MIKRTLPDPARLDVMIAALAFFLLGLAQSAVRMRLFFGISALAVMIIAVAWTVFIVIS